LETKKIYLVRHGQTNNNLNKILQGGNVDLGINETGNKQSEAFFNAYKHVPFVKIYLSKLKRTKESMQSFLDLGIPYEENELLNEISYGIYDGKVTSEGENSFYCKVVNEWENGNLSMKLEGGESPLDVQGRIKIFLNHILSKPNEDVILICMHGRAMRIFLSTILNYELSYMEMFKHSNLGLYILNYSSDTFSIEKFNDCSHLSDVQYYKTNLMNP
jgi:probable phosphoglycerate mutase